MKRSEPWFKCFPADWIEATRSLTPEQRGIYFDCLCLIYQFGKPLPDDDKWMSHQLHISTRLWRSVRDALVGLGKLVKTAEGYTNERAELELDSRSKQARTNAETAANRERTKREKSEKENKINETPARNEHHARAFQITDNRKKKEYSSATTVEQEAAREPQPAAAKPKIDFQKIHGQLVEAANGALNRTTGSLEAISEPLGWIEAGADLEKDILPAIRAIGHRSRPQSIRSWSYFAPAVSEAVERRKRGLPPVAEPGSQPVHRVSPDTVRYAQPAEDC